MKKILIYILVLLAAVSCYKKAEYNQTLGLLSKYNKLSADGGSTQVAVFSNTSWTVKMDRPVTWASIDRFNGVKSGYLVFDYEKNYARARRVNLIFEAGDKTMTLSMYQGGSIADSDCVMTLGGSSVTAPAAGMTSVIPFTFSPSNLIYILDEMFLTISYPAGQEPDTPWIKLASVETDSVVIDIDPNTTGASRTANIRLSHTDAGSYDSTEGDTVYSNSFTVVQNQ